MKRLLNLASVFVVVLANFLFLQIASGCSRNIALFKVRRDFKVIVKSQDGKVLEGLPVKLVFDGDSANEVVEAQTTDKDGGAFFRGLMVSNYRISVERGGAGTIARLWTVNDESGASEITLTWPMGPILTVQSVTGHLLAGKERFPFPGMNVWLTDTVSGKEIGRTSTDQQGAFMFQVASPGLYVLHIEPRMCAGICIQGRILIDVDPKAKNREFPRYGLTMTSCGLAGYKDDGSMVEF